MADLIPMLNVMLGLMAYFIIVTMTMSTQAAFNLQLPEEVKKDDIEKIDTTLLSKQGPMVIELSKEGQFIVEQAKLDQKTLISQLKLFMEQNKKDPIFFKPHPQQGYEKVLQTLATIRQVGGDRISLVIDDVQVEPVKS